LQSLLVTLRAGALLFRGQHHQKAPVMSFYDNWSAIMIAAIAGFVLVFTALIGARLLAPFARENAKGVSYECGMLPIGRNWSQVHVRYYLIAILFLIFDVETVFIFPWAMTYLALPEFVFWHMIAFILILSLGLVYAWKRGVLEWKS
jgi:NADH:ubiquinone oxidoreductase subunit 3 (subunit A)